MSVRLLVGSLSSVQLYVAIVTNRGVGDVCLELVTQTADPGTWRNCA